MKYRFHVVGVSKHEVRWFKQLKNMLGFIATKPWYFKYSEIIIYKSGKEFFRCNYKFASAVNAKQPREKELRKFIFGYFGMSGVKLEPSLIAKADIKLNQTGSRIWQ